MWNYIGSDMVPVEPNDNSDPIDKSKKIHRSRIMNRELNKQKLLYFFLKFNFKQVGDFLEWIRCKNLKHYYIFSF